MVEMILCNVDFVESAFIKNILCIWDIFVIVFA